jgi:predicted HAD superfamily phosphohydrolase YqeG
MAHLANLGTDFGTSFFARARTRGEAGQRPIDRSRILVIGDAMRTDIKGAHDQGFDSVADRRRQREDHMVI